MSAAFQTAINGRPGASYVDVPSDVLMAPYTEADARELKVTVAAGRHGPGIMAVARVDSWGGGASSQNVMAHNLGHEEGPSDLALSGHSALAVASSA